MTRKKAVVVVPPATMEEAKKEMATYSSKEKEANSIIAQQEKEIDKIRSKDQSKLDALIEARDNAYDKIQAFAGANKELFEKKKSYDMAQGTFGFRTGKHKLVTLKGFTFISAAATLLRSKVGKGYVKTAHSVIKDKLIADREDKAIKKLMEKVGVGVAQDETFFIDLKEENKA